MTPSQEALIERYVRFPTSLTEREHRLAADLLARDTVAREIAAYYRAFYEELDEVPERPRDQPAAQDAAS
jgi:hypothetical protein